MFYFLKVFADTPYIQDEAKEASNSDDDIVGMHIEPFPGNHTCFKYHKGRDQLQEYFFLERIIENYADNRSIDQVIKQNDSQGNRLIPVPVKNIGQIQNAVDHPEYGDNHIGFIFGQLFAPVNNEWQKGEGYCQ